MKVFPADMAKSLQDIRKYSNDVRKAALKEMESAAYEIDTHQKQNIRQLSSKSGVNYSSMMAANHVVINRAGKAATVYNDHKAAGFFEEGTKPHEIKVKTKKVLATLKEYTKGKGLKYSTDKKGNTYAVFGKRVFHPGTPKRPFFFPAVDKVKPKYIERLKQILNAK